MLLHRGHRGFIMYRGKIIIKNCLVYYVRISSTNIMYIRYLYMMFYIIHSNRWYICHVFTALENGNSRVVVIPTICILVFMYGCIMHVYIAHARQRMMGLCIPMYSLQTSGGVDVSEVCGKNYTIV